MSVTSRRKLSGDKVRLSVADAAAAAAVLVVVMSPPVEYAKR